jgi:hypothetical protein
MQKDHVLSMERIANGNWNTGMKNYMRICRENIFNPGG